MGSASKAMNIVEAMVKDGSFKWLRGKKMWLDDEFEDTGLSLSARKNWTEELSTIANLVVWRCSKVIGTPTAQLKEAFMAEASDSVKHSVQFPRNFLEYCCFRALSISVQVTDFICNKNFRRLSYDMMLAWESPEHCNSSPGADEELTVGVEAFSRIAPAIPVVADVITCQNLFELLTVSSGGKLHFSTYDKYLNAIEKSIKKMKSHWDSTHLSVIRSTREEKILDMDGTVTTQPVLEHVGLSTWPGRLTLTDYALYFEALRVVSYDKPKVYNLWEDLQQVIKPELTGPWGTRLFDKAVLYKSLSLPEPVVMEFPELKGHSRRDYWLAVTREILFFHRFLNKYQLSGSQREEARSKLVLGILRLQAIQETCSLHSTHYQTLLMFNFCDQLPGGDLILETLASIRSSRDGASAGPGLCSVSASGTMSGLGFGSAGDDVEGDLAVGKTSPLEEAVRESRSSYKKVVLAQESVAGVKVDGIDTNLAVMKELLAPVSEIGKWLLSIAYWIDPFKSLVFCILFTYIIWRGWLAYAFALVTCFLAVFVIIGRCCNRGGPADQLQVVAPPPMNTMEQLLAVQNAILQTEQIIQDGNIFLLKLRALFLSIFPQASETFALTLAVSACFLALVPARYAILILFLEAFTRYAPPRRPVTERWTRRLREWWFSIPAAPVVLEREDKKNK